MSSVKVALTFIFIWEAAPFFLVAWLRSDFKTAYAKFEEIIELIIE